MSYFTWVYSDATNFLVWEHDDSVGQGWSRSIGTLVQAQGYGVYANWIAVPNTPAQVAGNSYVTFPGGVPTFNQTQYNADQLSAQQAGIRAQRNRLLSESDFVLASDTIFPNAIQATAWKTYRTALRNVPQQTAFASLATIGTIVWPTIPYTIQSGPY